MTYILTTRCVSIYQSVTESVQELRASEARSSRSNHDSRFIHI